MNNLNVVFIFVPGPIGGAEKVVIEGLKALSPYVDKLSLWVIKEERAPRAADDFLKLTELGYEVKVFNCRSVFDLKLIESLKICLRTETPDIIHAHGFKAAVYSQLSNAGDSKLVVTHHGKTAHTLKVKIYEYIETLILRRAQKVVAVSQQMKEGLIQDKIPSNKIEVIENPLTISLLENKATKSDILNLLYVGRLSPEKGCQYLIEALKGIKGVKLTIVGDGVAKSALEERVKILQLSEQVIFEGFQKNVATYLIKSHALVMPSLREGLPLTLVEACCSGVPVIASKVGGIPSVLKHDVNGLLVEPANSLAIREAIEKLAEKYEIYQLNAKNLSQSYKERFSAHTWAENTIKTYQTLLNQL